MRPSPIALTVLLAALAAAPAAGAATGNGSTSPVYPGNALRIEAPDRVVSGSVITSVRLAGTASWNQNPTTDTTPGFSFSLYVQDPTVDATCAPTFDQQRQKSINVNPNGTAGGSGFVVTEGLSIGPAVPAPQATYSQAVPPFIVKPGLKRVLLCAYQRYVVDEVATAALPVGVDPAACRLRSSSVPRGSALRVRCNVKGPLTIRLKRGKTTRTVRGTVPSSGDKSLSSKRLPEGLYRASFSISGQALGNQRVRIR